MTKEEAIKSALKYLVHKQQEQGSWGYADNNDNEISWNEVIRWVDQQPCGDCISRQAVIDTIETDCSWDIFNEWGSRTPTGEYIINAIKSVPSVEPERKTGKWIVYEDCEGKTRTCTCNLCGYETGEYTWENPNYCENCGAKMEVDG